MTDVLILNADGNPLSLMPISIINWQVAIRLVFVDKVQTLVEHDDWVVRSPSTTMAVPAVVMCTEYAHWVRQVKYSRHNVLLRDNYTCQLQSTYKCKQAHGKGHKPNELTIDHVVPRKHNGKTSWTNVTTACRDCNSDKGSDKNIRPIVKPVKPSYYQLVNKRMKMPIVIRHIVWLDYLQWDRDLIWYHPPNGSPVKVNDYLNQ